MGVREQVKGKAEKKRNRKGKGRPYEGIDDEQMTMDDSTSEKKRVLIPQGDRLGADQTKMRRRTLTRSFEWPRQQKQETEEGAEIERDEDAERR